MNLLRNSKLSVVAVALSAGVIVAVPAASSSAKTVVGHEASISATSFTNSLTALAQLKSVAARGEGKIAAILPDTTSSTRYTEFDTPDLKKAAKQAGLPSSDMIVFVSVLRRISGRSLLINPPGLLVRNYFAEPNLTFGQRGPSFRGCLGVDGGGFCQ